MSTAENIYSPNTPPTVAHLAARAAAMRRPHHRDHSGATYKSAQLGFLSWCGDMGVMAREATPEVVAAYLVDLSDQGFAYNSIQTRAYGIRHWYEDRKLNPNPAVSDCVKDVLKTLRATLPAARPQSRALHRPDMRKLHRAMWDGAAKGDFLVLRDRAFLAIGFATALRPQQLLALRITDLRKHSGGVVVTMRSCPGDQKRPWELFLEEDSEPLLCPLRSLLDWWEALGAGHKNWVFPGVALNTNPRNKALSIQSATKVLRRWIGVAGLDPEAYSLRSLSIHKQGVRR